jgi:nucleolar protein 14
LLVEYKQLKKNNAFIDRRFGEDDESLTNDERALLRFQKQRLRELAGSKFTLAADEDNNAGEDAQLTHLGRSLAEMDEEDEKMGRGWDDDDDGFDARMDAQMTRDLHFGGGFVPSKTTRDIPNENDDDRDENGHEHRKSKKEVMEEIIAKSKMHKALKSQQKEEDIVATEKLDDAWKELSQGGLLAGLLRSKGAGKDEVKNLNIDESDKAFDRLTKELIFEAKAQPGERTLTAEELADLERHRLEELEKQRVKRQKGESGFVGGDDLEDDFEGLGDGFGGGAGGGDDVGILPTGGYAARRAKQAQKEAERAKKKRSRNSDSDDSDGSSEGGSDSSDGSDDDDALLTALDLRRKQRAMGDHPLQEAFRGVAANLLAKHGLAEDQEESESEDEEEESGEEDEADGSGSSEEEDDESEDESEEDEQPTAKPSKQKSASTKLSEQEENQESLKMSFTPPLPETYSQFSAMAKDLSSEDLGELLRRIRGFNATALSTDGRKKTQVLYGCVVQHYVSMAGTVPLPMSHLDALVPHILELTPQVPFYAATLARARLQRAHQQMSQRLKDPVMRATAWPAPKTLLLLKLLTTVYPASDKKHPVLTPASLFVCSALALCPLARPRDVASGLFLATVAVQMHAGARRFCPEPLDFAVNILRSCYTDSPSSTTSNENTEQQKWLALPTTTSPSATTSAPANSSEIKDLSLLKIFNEESTEYLHSVEFKCAAAGVALRLIDRIAESLAGIDALPEIIAPAVDVLKHLINAGLGGSGGANGVANGKHKNKKSRTTTNKEASTTVAPGVAALAEQVLEKILTTMTSITSRRRPLFNKTLAAVPEARQFNPLYEENFASGKNYDPDRDRAERKKLQRELRREERGAARELRRDSAFMAGVRDKEKANLHADLDASARRAMSFLEQQQADARSGGQGGHWRKNKGLKR